MIIRTTILVLAAAFAAGPLAAQQRGVNLRLAQGQPPRYTPPLCPLKTINDKVEKGSALLRKAYDAKTPAEKSATLNEARQNLVDAIVKEAQTGNAAAWYYLGRIALLRGDPVAADSDFTRAQDLVPSCEIDITQYRQNSWAVLGQAGIEMQKKGQADSALAQFRDATYLFRGLPHVFSNMGVVFANNGHDDSAAVYFQKALSIAEKDTSLTEDRNAAAINLAIMYKRENKQLEAIQMLHRYLAWKPGDTDARKELANSFRVSGMVDSAEKVEAAMVADFAKINPDSLDTADLMALGVHAFNAGQFVEARNAFSKTVKRNPWSREAHYNLASAYLPLAKQAHDSADALRKAKQDAAAARLDSAATGFDQHLVEEGSKLVEMEPMSADALRLLAQGQRGLKQDENVLKSAERLVGLPFTVDVSGFQMSQTGARFMADATGRSPMDAAGKPLKTGPMSLVFEFVDQAGTVIDSKEVTIPVLAKDAKHSFQIDAKGTGIAGWRYHLK